jgi:hypothetical protein
MPYGPNISVQPRASYAWDIDARYNRTDHRNDTKFFHFYSSARNC